MPKLSRKDFKELKSISFRIAILNGLSMLDADHFGKFMIEAAKANKLSRFELHIRDFIKTKFRVALTRPKNVREQ